MKKPTKEDLERIKDELTEMYKYMTENFPTTIQKKWNSADEITFELTGILDALDCIIVVLPDIRENVINDH